MQGTVDERARVPCIPYDDVLRSRPEKRASSRALVESESREGLSGTGSSGTTLQDDALAARQMCSTMQGGGVRAAQEGEEGYNKLETTERDEEGGEGGRGEVLRRRAPSRRRRAGPRRGRGCRTSRGGRGCSAGSASQRSSRPRSEREREKEAGTHKKV